MLVRGMLMRALRKEAGIEERVLVCLLSVVYKISADMAVTENGGELNDADV